MAFFNRKNKVEVIKNHKLKKHSHQNRVMNYSCRVTIKSITVTIVLKINCHLQFVMRVVYFLQSFYCFEVSNVEVGFVFHQSEIVYELRIL